jgi:hypothetical protein
MLSEWKTAQKGPYQMFVFSGYWSGFVNDLIHTRASRSKVADKDQQFDRSKKRFCWIRLELSIVGR